MIVDVYCRISRDQEGAGLGVKRQEADCRNHLQQHGHQVGEVLVDNDLSGYNRKPRPAYRHLLERVRSRASAGFVVWHLDRLTRHPTELEEVIEAVEASGALVFTVTGGAYDLGTTDGRAMARVVGAFARKESEDKARRTRRKHLELAEAGRPVGGTRHFGYDALRVDGEPVLLDDSGYPTLRVRPDEAAIIRQAIEGVLAGESLRSVVARWNATGVTPTRGGRVTLSAVRRILTSPTIAGWRALDGQRIARGTWAPIVDDDTHARVCAVIAARATGRAEARTYLLPGLIRCGRCGAGLVSQRRYPHGRDTHARSYQCTSDPGKDSCGRLRIVAAETEAEVLARLLARLDDRTTTDTPVDVSPMLVELERLEADQARLATDYYAERLIDRGQFFAASSALTGRIGALRAQVAALAEAEAVAPTVADRDRLATEWDDMDLGRRRAVLARFIDRIVIHPATNPARGIYDPTRVEVIWRA
jgi:DNA invertase Pin-like site-specific DNA recombinase